MQYRFHICDVFTNARFGGNQLAVLPDARGLSANQMQQIAREFNFAETTFVFPPESGHTRQVRIFTPSIEVPFAGHPNIGTAFVLASIGELGHFDNSIKIIFEEQAGLVPIVVTKTASDSFHCELKAPETLSLGRTLPVEMVAAALSISADDILTTSHLPLVASVGFPFVIVELRDRAGLKNARINLVGLEKIVDLEVTSSVHLYVRSRDEFDIRARMFAPLLGVPEDPATGSANCALIGLLTHLEPSTPANLNLKIAQGMEMGRPSVLETRAEKSDHGVTHSWVAGNCVMFAEGQIQVA